MIEDFFNIPVNQRCLHVHVFSHFAFVWHPKKLAQSQKPRITYVYITTMLIGGFMFLSDTESNPNVHVGPIDANWKTLMEKVNNSVTPTCHLCFCDLVVEVPGRKTG
jgi:hypothetical protein